MDEVPPFELQHELNHDLSIIAKYTDSPNTTTSPHPPLSRPPSKDGEQPFLSLTRTINNHDVRGPANRKNTLQLPGHPLLNLSDTVLVRAFLHKDLTTPRLDRLFPILWLVATPDSAHVAPLHENLVRGRNPIITEDPGLHLVWYYDRICIKPLPEYLLNHAFWSLYLTTPELRTAALGYVRSWAHLIQYPSDFYIAHQRNLIPASITSYEDLLLYLEPFRENFDDESVSLRYRYGDLRLSRLNLWSKIYLREMFYHRVSGQHSAYFARFVPAFLFVFGTVSVGLGSMQVVVAVDEGKLGGVAKWYSVACLLIVAATFIFFPAMQVLLLGRELLFVTRMYFSGTWRKPKKAGQIDKAA